MAFELIKKIGAGCKEFKEFELRIGKASISFSPKLAKIFKGYYGCEIFVDRKNKLIKFTPSRFSSRAYKMSKKRLSTNSTKLKYIFKDLIGF